MMLLLVVVVGLLYLERLTYYYYTRIYISNDGYRLDYSKIFKKNPTFHSTKKSPNRYSIQSENSTTNIEPKTTCLLA